MSAERTPVTNLRPGMYVLNQGISRIIAPPLYMRKGIVTDQNEVDGIIQQGFARLSTIRSAPFLATSQVAACRAFFTAYGTGARLGYTTPFWHNGMSEWERTGQPIYRLSRQKKQGNGEGKKEGGEREEQDQTVRLSTAISSIWLDASSCRANSGLAR